MTEKYHTLVIKGDLKEHPRHISIDGVEYEVSCSADGHTPAEMEPYETLVKEISTGTHDHLTIEEDLAHLAVIACEKAFVQQENGYDEQ